MRVRVEPEIARDRETVVGAGERGVSRRKVSPHFVQIHFSEFVGLSEKSHWLFFTVRAVMLRCWTDLHHDLWTCYFLTFTGNRPKRSLTLTPPMAPMFAPSPSAGS